ncbi:type IV pilin [Halovenus rubra]|uniref:Type IV pilin n=2 Tax=Halovenus rubra TaxID=869890 RepID=A0ABD5X0K2_9EURY|nr:type IV pilin [Halovenus rubra]
MQGVQTGGRAISPVIGVVLLVAIVVALAAGAGAMIFSLTDESDPQPNARLSLEPTDDANGTFVLRHAGGANLTGAETRLIGVVSEDALLDEQFVAGEEIKVRPVTDEVTLVWYGENTDHVLQRFDVEPSSLLYDPTEIDNRCDWVADDVKANGDLDMSDDKGICNVKEDLDTAIDDVNIDLDSGSALIGNLDTDGDVDLDSSDVVGSITSDADDITITSNSNVYGDIVAQSDTNIDIDGNSYVDGAVVVNDGSLSLDNVSIDGHVYADDSDFPGSCPDTTIGPSDTSCSEYDPRDPDDY